MNCPSCNQIATSFLRNAFSLHGVSFFKSVQGYLRCQHCGTLLRITGYGKRFWYFYIPTMIALLVFVLLYQRVVPPFGVDVGLVWVVLGLLIISTFTFGVWKHAQFQKVDEDAKSTAASNT